MPIRTSGPVLQTPDPRILIAVEDLVPGFAGDTKLPTHGCHFLAV
jgi:hypothetical protein